MRALPHELAPSIRVADPFVGRARELDQVCRAGEALRQGRGCLIVVSGEAGIGKTRFFAEAAARARQSGVRVVEARCWLDGGAPPLWPWQPILDELCGEGSSALLAAGRADAHVGPDRFARFAAVTERLAEACADSPVCLVIDDVQGADAGALLLIRFVARSLSRIPLMLVLGRRSGEPAQDSDEARLLDELERDAIHLTLGAFDRDETELFLTEHGLGTPPPGLVDTLHRLTRGHPLFLRRIAQTIGTAEAGQALQGGLQVAIEQALGTVSDESRRILSVAAVLGPNPLLGETAEVAGVDAVAVLHAVDEGGAAGLVGPVADGRFEFAHELLRTAIEESLSVGDLLEAHARAAAVVADDTAAGPRAHRLARAAHHARCAAARSREDARRAVDICEAAAQAMVRNFAYEQADELFSAAMELHESARLGKPDSMLALEWAQAASLRGHLTEARKRFGVALTRAEAQGRPGLLAEAVLGWAGIWLDDYTSPVEKARMLSLYGKAYVMLPDDPNYDVQRIRLHVRAAAEATYNGDPVDDLRAAVEAARQSCDPRALAEALSLSHHALLKPEHTRDRLPLADELIQVTSETDLGVLALMGQLWRTIDLLHLGDPQFVRSLELLRERAMALQNKHMLWNVAVIDVLVAIGQGRFDEAEADALRCHALGEEIGRPDALPYYAGQLGVIRWLQGRDAELLDLIQQVSTSPRLADTEFSFWAFASCLAARAGDHDRARSILSHCMPPSMTDLASSGTWMVGMVALVEAAAALGDRDLAGHAYDLMKPYADLPAVAGLGVVCLGSNERSLGLAAGVLGRHDAAVEHLERAVVANQRLINRSLLVISRGDLAVALVRRAEAEGSGRDRDRAVGLLRQAIADGTEMSMTGRVEVWEEQLRSLQKMRPDPASTNGAHPDTRPPADRSASPVDVDPLRGTVRHDGRRWIVALDGRRVRVGNLVGMRYLSELLTHPGQSIPAAVLAEQVADPGQPLRQEVLDDKARDAYAARARELTQDLAEAEAANDLHRAERLRVELDTLVDELEAATGLNGRPRHFTDDHERARVAVQKAIKRAIDAVEDGDPAIADRFRQTVTTGASCRYTPDPKAPITWSTRER